MATTIQNATDNDVDTMNQLLRHSKAHWGYDKEFLDKFMEKYAFSVEKLKKTTARLFYLDKKMIGLYGFIIDENNMLELDYFFLHPDYVGKGFGYGLWYACCNTAKEMGRNEFVIWSDPNAAFFYMKMGCEKIGTRQSPMMPDRNPPVFKYKMKK